MSGTDPDQSRSDPRLQRLAPARTNQDRTPAARSPTAERVFAKRSDLDVRSAGTNDEALARVNARMLAWADIIFVMEDRQRASLERMFPDYAALARTVCLDIRDEYSFLDGVLIKLLEERVAPHLEAP